jgi:hypothetical protein
LKDHQDNPRNLKSLHAQLAEAKAKIQKVKSANAAMVKVKLEITKIKMSKFGFSFSWKRLLGITSAKQRFARQTGIPTTQQGMERKIGASIFNLIYKWLFGKK